MTGSDVRFVGAGHHLGWSARLVGSAPGESSARPRAPTGRRGRRRRRVGCRELQSSWAAASSRRRRLGARRRSCRLLDRRGRGFRRRRGRRAVVVVVVVLVELRRGGRRRPRRPTSSWSAPRPTSSWSLVDRVVVVVVDRRRGRRLLGREPVVVVVDSLVVGRRRRCVVALSVVDGGRRRRRGRRDWRSPSVVRHDGHERVVTPKNARDRRAARRPNLPSPVLIEVRRRRLRSIVYAPPNGTSSDACRRSRRCPCPRRRPCSCTHSAAPSSRCR